MATVLKNRCRDRRLRLGWERSLAKELTEAGLNVVALERGPMRDTWPDGAYPQVIDELTYNIRRKLFQGSIEKHRHHPAQHQPTGGALSPAGGLPAGYRRGRRRAALVRRPFPRRSH